MESLDVMPSDLLRRHVTGDWGDVCLEDAAENNLAVQVGDLRILSSYGTGEERLWVIAEADRSATTILRPEDY